MSAEEASAKEIETIEHYDSSNPSKGYNYSKGGFGVNSDTMSERWKDPAFNESMRSKMKEAWKDPEKRNRRSQSAKDRWADNSFKTSVTNKIKEVCGTSILCVETGIIYKNICDAEAELHINHSNICRAIRTGYKCGGYHWKKIDNVS